MGCLSTSALASATSASRSLPSFDQLTIRSRCSYCHATHTVQAWSLVEQEGQESEALEEVMSREQVCQIEVPLIGRLSGRGFARVYVG